LREHALEVGDGVCHGLDQGLAAFGQHELAAGCNEEGVVEMLDELELVGVVELLVLVGVVAVDVLELLLDELADCVERA